MIREATDKDYMQICAVWKAAMEEMYIDGSEIIPTMKSVTAALTDIWQIIAGTQSGIVMLCEEDSLVVGCQVLIEATFNVSTRFGKTMSGSGIYVDPQYRKRGIYTGMWKKSIETARERGYDTIVGFSMHDNEFVFNAMSGMGFRPHTNTLSLEV